MTTRGIRGATTTKENTKAAIVAETKSLLSKMLSQNAIKDEDIVSIFFSMTKDLNAIFPAVAARELNLSHTPLLCLNEVEVPNSVNHCIRILMHVNSTKAQSDITHVYLNEATTLRPEFAQTP